MNKGYDKAADMSEPLRFYELWRGISNLIMSYIETILKFFGVYNPENEG